jgi:hypothetical protein
MILTPNMILQHGGKMRKETTALHLKGEWILTATYKGTKRVYKILKGHNLIVSTGKYMVGDMLIDTSAQYDTGITYHSIGTSDTAPAITDTQLTAEVARMALTTKTRSGGAITLTVFYTAAQSTYNIKEAGLHGTSTASGTANSGVMFSHYLVSFDNSGGLYDLTYQYILTIG